MINGVGNLTQNSIILFTLDYIAKTLH